MTVHRSGCTGALILALVAGGCGTPKEKTAPCKRPADLSSYVAEPRLGCGPMTMVNTDPAATLRAIDALQGT